MNNQNTDLPLDSEKVIAFARNHYEKPYRTTEGGVQSHFRITGMPNTVKVFTEETRETIFIDYDVIRQAVQCYNHEIPLNNKNALYFNPLIESYLRKEAVRRRTASLVGIIIRVVSYIALIIVIPLLYYNQNLDPDTVNRLGIVLNFLAGFFLAPELLGERRLDQIEENIETTLTKISKLISKIESSIQRGSGRIRNWFIVVSGTVLTFIFLPSVLSLFETDFTSATTNILLIYITSTLTLLFLLVVFIDDGIKLTMANIIYLPIVIMLQAWTWILIVAPLVSAVWLSRVVVQTGIKSLTGDKRLRSILVSVGILTFIVGNLLQLIATF